MLQNNQKPKFVILIIMDGVGAAPRGPGNAVAGADTKNLDALWPKYPHGMLEASGLYVGLPKGTDGNSEVGHMTIGAGKIILQDLPRIDKAIENGSFMQNPILLEAFDHAIGNDGFVHLIGLVGNGYVHSSFNHLVKLLDFAVSKNIDPNKLFIHPILDGRDSSLDAGFELLDRLEAYLIQRRIGLIATIIGRAYAMDRNKNWIRTRAAYDLFTEGKGNTSSNWRKTLKNYYLENKSDEYFDPTITSEAKELREKPIQQGDSVIFFNYRPDRALQITKAFEGDDFEGWSREKLNNLYYAGFTDYKNGFPKNIIFPQERIIKPLGRIIAENGLKQLRIAESEKFPHVTYFFNGGNGTVFENENWIQIPSPKDVATYDLKPEMSQREVADEVIKQIEEGSFDFAVVNFAGPDMVAHTGNIEATKKAIEVCDESIGRIVNKTLELGGAVMITADHGNAEELIDLQTGAPDTKHSTNQVPVMIIKKGLAPVELSVGGLADIAPTILYLFEIPVPPEITGKNLLE